jgi:hypothetical protein
MFDQILQLVKEHLGNNPAISAGIPAGQEDAVHNEIATHLTNSLTTQPAEGGGMFSGGALPGILQKYASKHTGTGA